jgi:hypothetical protein
VGVPGWRHVLPLFSSRSFSHIRIPSSSPCCPRAHSVPPLQCRNSSQVELLRHGVPVGVLSGALTLHRLPHGVPAAAPTPLSRVATEASPAEAGDEYLAVGTGAVSDDDGSDGNSSDESAEEITVEKSSLDGIAEEGFACSPGDGSESGITPSGSAPGPESEGEAGSELPARPVLSRGAATRRRGTGSSSSMGGII